MTGCTISFMSLHESPPWLLTNHICSAAQLVISNTKLSWLSCLHQFHVCVTDNNYCMSDALHVLNAHSISGVDWSLVAEHVSMDNAYEQFLDPEASQSQQQGWMGKLKGWLWGQKPLKEDRSAPQTPGTLTPHSHRGAPGGIKTEAWVL